MTVFMYLIMKHKLHTMESKKNIGTIIFGAAAAWAVYSYLKMRRKKLN